MKKNAVYFTFILFLFLNFTKLQATTITIGTDTSNQRQPFGVLFGYERSAALYTNAEIGGTGNITAIGFYVATSSNIVIPAKIYLKITTDTTLTSSTWENMIAGAKMYESNLTFSNTGWSTLNLGTAFSYTGNNLLILVETNYGDTGTSLTKPAFNYTSSTSRHQYWYQDNTPPTSTGLINSNRPNVQITYTPFGVTPPVNDQCSGAITVTCGSSTNGTTVNATTTGDPTATCVTAITAPGVWYKFTGDGSDVTVDLCGATYNSKLSIYTGSCDSLVCLTGEDDDFTACGGDDPSITFNSTSGTTYYFFVHGYGTETGTFTLNVACSSVTPPNCPNLSSPANNSTNVGVVSSLNWTTPTGGGNVNYYKLYFGTNNPPTNILNGTNIGNVLTYSCTMLPNTTYYWKVTAVNAAGESNGCTVRQFETGIATTLIIDTSSNDPTELVQNYLISGCLEAKNVTFKGKRAQIGNFFGGSNTVGYEQGLVLSSGNAKDAEGPNSSSTNTTDLGQPGDADINTITSPNTSYDAAVLEFDFKSNCDTILFRYTFASEEYNEWIKNDANEGYNDAFAFLLTSLSSAGPQYNKKNIALIPGTSTPVTINNVNNGYATAGNCGPGPGINSSYFRDNACSPYKYNIECDGLTTVLTASASVKAGEWYHIKLVVADVNDKIVDSWVFLEANSFFTESCIGIDVSNPLTGKNTWEGSEYNVTFKRKTSSKEKSVIDVSYPITINYKIDGTANQGIDYASVPNSVIIPVGDTSVTVTLKTYNDCITEGVETIIFSINDAWNLRDTIFLKDSLGLHGNIQEPDQSICQGQSITLHGVVSAFSNYLCTWNSGSTFISHNQNITVNPTTTTTYNFTASDSCGNTFNDIVTISVSLNSIPPTPVITTNGNVLESDATTGNQWYNDSGIIIGETAQSYTPTSTGNYYVIVTDLNGCISNISNVINVLFTGITNNQTNETGVYLYPNPSNKYITIESKSICNDGLVSIYNIKGELLIQNAFQQSKIKIDISMLTKGIYFVKVKTDNGIVVKKLVKE